MRSSSFNHRRRNQGFSLIELMVVVTLAMTLIAIGLAWLKAETARALRGEIVATHATELATLTRALQEYLDTASGLPTSRAFDVSAQSLVDAKVLPAGFAVRAMTGRTTPSTPIGQSYRLRAIEQDGDYRGIVYADGNVNAGMLARGGIENTPMAIGEYSAAVMRRVRRTHAVRAGYVNARTLSINPEVSGFNYSLVGLLSAYPPRPTAVGLAGFDELAAALPIRVEVGTSGDGGGGSTADQANCHWVQKQQVFTSNDVFTPSQALIDAGGTVTVRAIGGGGGGGRVSSGVFGAGGGGSGADITRVISGISYSVPVTVGFGAPTGLTASPAPGGTTSFGNYVRAPGGRTSWNNIGGAAGGEGGEPGQNGFPRGDDGSAPGPSGQGGGAGSGGPNSGGGGAGFEAGHSGLLVVTWEEPVCADDSADGSAGGGRRGS